MSSKSPRLEVGCVLPTNFDADVEFRVKLDGKEGPYFEHHFEHHRWTLAGEDKFLASIKRQMELLRQNWLKQTDSQIDIEAEVGTYDRPITHIALSGKKDPVYRIEIPEPADLVRDLGPRRAFFILMPFECAFFKKLARKQKAPDTEGQYLWMPCTEAKEIPRPKLRGGYNDELGHWVRNRLKDGCIKVCSPHKKPPFWQELRRELTPEVVSYLCTGEWPECQCGDTEQVFDD